MKISCGYCTRPFALTDPIEIRASRDGLVRMVRAECGCGAVAWLVRASSTWIVAMLEPRRPIVVRRVEAP